MLEVEEPMTDGEEEEEVERKSKIMEKAYVKTAEEVLRYKKKKNKPWLSQEAWTLIDQIKESHQAEVNRCKIRETKTTMAR